MRRRRRRRHGTSSDFINDTGQRLSSLLQFRISEILQWKESRIKHVIESFGLPRMLSYNLASQGSDFPLCVLHQREQLKQIRQHPHNCLGSQKPVCLHILGLFLAVCEYKPSALFIYSSCLKQWASSQHRRQLVKDVTGIRVQKKVPPFILKIDNETANFFLKFEINYGIFP